MSEAKLNLFSVRQRINLVDNAIMSNELFEKQREAYADWLINNYKLEMLDKMTHCSLCTEFPFLRYDA
tara:strand:+ start:18 stop:221 length:204 start_codon:yes stop_codon:yes gene_type:complete